MSIRKSFISTLAITALLINTVSAECVGGHCQVDMKNLHKIKRQTFSNVSTRVTHIASLSQMPRQMTFVPQPQHSMDYMDQSFTVIVDGQEIVRLAHERYIMTAVERAEFYEREAEKILLEQPIPRIEQKLMETTTLPQSEYFCDIPKKPVFTNPNGVYECV